MSTRKFSVGDRVRVNLPGSTYHGMETTVISALRQSFNCVGLNGEIARGIWVHTVDIKPAYAQCVAFEPHELVPLYDGRETVSWSECAWQPRALKV